jgi:hypothetical protein
MKPTQLLACLLAVVLPGQLLAAEANVVQTQQPKLEQLAPKTEPLTQELVGVLFERINRQQKIEFGLLCRALIGPQTTLRAYAATLLGDSGDKRAIPFLIDALSDDSLHVGADYVDAGDATTRHRANKALKKLTAQDFGFVWNDPEEKRNEAIRKWIAWYKKQNKATSKSTMPAQK